MGHRLRQVPHVAASPATPRALSSSETDATPARDERPGQQPQQGCLARTVGAEQNGATIRNLQIQPINNTNATPVTELHPLQARTSDGVGSIIDGHQGGSTFAYESHYGGILGSSQSTV